MLILFCLRLALGLIACLVLFSPKQVNPRFYRTHFLTALGLAAAALLMSWNDGSPATRGVLLGSIALAVAGSVSWSLEGAPAGRTIIVLTTLCLVVGLALAQRGQSAQLAEAGVPSHYSWLVAVDLASAALLGSATTAMLMGHSYLIAPSMSLTPLLRVSAALFVATFARMVLAGAGLALCSWQNGGEWSNLGSVSIWLPVRWAIGLVGPLVLGWMAWQAAKIRSTQSATGILYVVVILCYLGELTGQLLQVQTGYLC